ncbi:MAG: hypothetical protein CMJ85_06990 [Planctomycetes bacterium]|jgi:pimeloyl-ACP methyl ester carboxylesterase|nr:hypothetical protein [Planctomycetota bacterium]MDP6424004.1 hypothetical protein [Planctomycetota bacterium]
MKALLSVLCATVLVVVSAHAQTHYPVGRKNFFFENPTGQGSPRISCTVFYPAVSTGDKTPILRRSGGWPVVVFLHGHSLPGFLYVELGFHLAERGYLTVLKSTTRYDADLQYKDALALIPALQFEHLRKGAFLQGQLDTDRMGLAGHSMGGGNTIRVLTATRRFKAAVVFAPWIGFGSKWVEKEAALVRTPIAIITGQGDTISPWDKHGSVLFDQLKAPDSKTLYVLNKDCDHLNVVAWINSTRPWAKEVFEGSMDVATGVLDHYLLNDQRGLDRVVGPASKTNKRLFQHKVRAARPEYFKSGPEGLGKTTLLHIMSAPGPAAHFVSYRASRIPTPFGLFFLDLSTVMLPVIGFVAQSGVLPMPWKIPDDTRLKGAYMTFQGLGMGRSGVRLTTTSVDLFVPK